MKYHVYVAGPFTLGDPEKNTYNALDAADEIIERFKNALVPIVPHLSFWWDQYSTKDTQWWYDYTMEQARRCDVLLRLPGKSRGSDEEVAEFGRMGKAVVYSMDQLGAWLNAKQAVTGDERYFDGRGRVLEPVGNA